jgi:hypothetical protein
VWRPLFFWAMSAIRAHFPNDYRAKISSADD